MVSKILKTLAREGLLMSHRGVKGGYSLAQRPEHIPISRVIEALEGPIGLTECCVSRSGGWSSEIQPGTAAWDSRAEPAHRTRPTWGTPPGPSQDEVVGIRTLAAA